jgi:hypothetical protein
MANPNLASASSVLVGNALIRLTSTSATQVVSNAASSGKAYLIDSLIVSNVDGSNTAEITIDLFASATNTGTATKIAHTVTVPADATLIVIGKENPLSLLEAQSIYATASAADDLHVIASWKELS